MEIAIIYRLYLASTLSLLGLGLYGQIAVDYKGVNSGASVIDGDTIPWVFLDDILVLDNPTFSDIEARKSYYLLRRRVLKVYPYAKGLGEKLDSLENRLSDDSNKRGHKRQIRQYHKLLKDKFAPELHKLTVSEGQILCKLIYRETGKTIFEILKSHRSILRAIVWGITASWWDISIRKEYLPNDNEEDALIEQILLRAFANNFLQPGTYYYRLK